MKVTVTEHMVKYFKPRCHLCGKLLEVGEKAEKKRPSSCRETRYYCKKCVGKFG